MPFILVTGRYKPLVGKPDGDSVRFLADDKILWSKLEGTRVRLGTSVKSKDTAQLRFEGIDAIEKAATEPLATDAKDNMLRLINFSQSNPEPAGYILARMTDDKSGRPIAFVFTGKTAKKDGSEIYLDAKMLQDSVNYQQMKDGYAYPLYYNTLFTSLRTTFDKALAYARGKGLGYWPSDHTLAGVTVRDHGDLATISPIWPKLWRRMDEYLRKHDSLQGFVQFLEDRDERVDVLSVMEERGLQDVVKVTGNKVKLTEQPENLRVRANAGRR